MKNIYLKKIFIYVLTAFLSISARGKEPLGLTTLATNANKNYWGRLDTAHLKIIYFGSSVPYGSGATNQKGYTSLFSDILKKRISTTGHSWETVNISIGGDNTVKVLNRYKTDLLPLNGQYVVFALALGNEGIHERGQPMFDQFVRNIQILIDQAKSDGYTPIITNSYTRNDYNEKDYRFIKDLNLLIQRWDVPSINLLGAVDDLAGHWVDEFWADGAHPNDAGHTEMSYTIVPSLFDALESKKPTPKRVKGSHIKLSGNKSRKEYIVFTPEHIVHPFTTAISFKASTPGTLLQINDAEGAGTISINNEGYLVYSSVKTGLITGTSKVNDGEWHSLSLAHYYAKGITLLYCDSTLQGTLQERLVTTDLMIGGDNIPKKLFCKNWLFYRSAMNQEEINSLAQDSLLKSSLELYAPLDSKKASVSAPFVNLAQSMNTLKIK